MIEGTRFELERAITHNELELHYQPVFAIDGRAVRDVEALVRWRHPERGVVSPHAFLPAAEREGLMHDLTAWVLREALLQASVWKRDGLAVRVAVNVALSDLRDTGFRRLVERTLRVTTAETFAAEVDAGAAPDEVPARALEALRAKGIPITLDNVTSVEQLDRAGRLPLDVVKLGREVVSRAASDARALETARGIRHVAAARALEVLAVGVEDERALQVARTLGCAGAQGYHLARPMTNVELTRWLQRRA